MLLSTQRRSVRARFTQSRLLGKKTHFQNPQIFQQTISLLPEHSTLACECLAPYGTSFTELTIRTAAIRQTRQTWQHVSYGSLALIPQATFQLQQDSCEQLFSSTEIESWAVLQKLQKRAITN
jgi:hypothetical protein